MRASRTRDAKAVRDRLLERLMQEDLLESLPEARDCAKPIEDLGLASMDLSGILALIEEEFGVAVPPESIYAERMSIDKIAAYVAESMLDEAV
jgi:acyl carrier protein